MLSHRTRAFVFSAPRGAGEPGGAGSAVAGEESKLGAPEMQKRGLLKANHKEFPLLVPATA